MFGCGLLLFSGVGGFSSPAAVSTTNLRLL
jgi:hypothetical protein